MISDIEEKKINCVIVKDLSRLGRDYIDTGQYLERYFPEHDVRFISIMDNIDSKLHIYDMLVPIKNIFNEQYARDISGKVHASIETKQRAGEFIGAFASYGYKKSPTDKNKLIIDAYAAEVVRKVFRMYIKGYGKIRIARLLNEQGIPCPSEYKKINGENYKNGNRLNSTSYWTYSTIDRMLRNQIYIGNMVQGKKVRRLKGKARSRKEEDWIVVANTHPAIVDDETWEKAGDMLKRRTRNLDFVCKDNIFAGFLRCGDCNRAMSKKKSGNKEMRYYCGTYVRSGRQFCTPHAVPFYILEKIILEDLNILIGQMGNLYEIIEQIRVPTDTAGYVEERRESRFWAELERVRKLKKAVYEDYRSDLISREEFISYRQDYQKKEELLIKQKEVAEKAGNSGRTPDIMENHWVRRLLDLGSIEQLDRDIVMEMVHEIKIFEDHKIKIVYNFSDELQDLFKTEYRDNKENG
ncbi:MAG: recombinase family protein [Lachnospiraceae bacterium]|nr:recombinase family protein [Lachnospiraceae bacterium]